MSATQPGHQVAVEETPNSAAQQQSSSDPKAQESPSAPSESRVPKIDPAQLQASSEPAFHILSESRPGHDHIFGSYRGNGNQDSRGFRAFSRGMVAVSCDGCGSTPDSSTGSRAAVRIILNAVESLFERKELPGPEEFAQAIEKELLDRMRVLAQQLSKNPQEISQIIHQSYLYTMQIMVVTPLWTAVMGCGDGFWALNGELKEVLPKEGNQPEYLAYRLMNPVPAGFESVSMTVYSVVDTEKLRHAVVATDGIKPFTKPRKINGQRVRFSDFWNKRQFYTNAPHAQAVFNTLYEPENTLVVDEGFGAGKSVVVKLRERRGSFSDDVTYVIFRRNDSVSLPIEWTEYRKAHTPEDTQAPTKSDSSTGGAKTLPPAAATVPTPVPEPAPAASAQPAVAEPVTASNNPPAPKSPSGWQYLLEMLRSFFTLFGIGRRDDQQDVHQTQQREQRPRQSQKRRDRSRKYPPRKN